MVTHEGRPREGSGGQEPVTVADTSLETNITRWVPSGSPSGPATVSTHLVEGYNVMYQGFHMGRGGVRGSWDPPPAPPPA